MLGRLGQLLFLFVSSPGFFGGSRLGREGVIIGRPYHTRRRMTSRRLVKLKSAVYIRGEERGKSASPPVCLSPKLGGKPTMFLDSSVMYCEGRGCSELALSGAGG